MHTRPTHSPCLASVLARFYRQGDICKEATTAIVNAANERMIHGAGVARAIADAAGNGIVDRESAEWIKENGLLETGRRAAITSAGKLPCKCVIHVTGPTHEVDAHLLRGAVLVALDKAEEAQCDSVALPAISSGIFGFPLALCARILVQCGIDFARAGPRFVRHISYCNIDIQTAQAFKKALEENGSEPSAATLRSQDSEGGYGSRRQVSDGADRPSAPRMTGNAVSTCSVAGCDRISWNEMPNEECCRTCRASQGVSHGPTCENNHRARRHRDIARTAPGQEERRLTFAGSNAPGAQYHEGTASRNPSAPFNVSSRWIKVVCGRRAFYAVCGEDAYAAYSLDAPPEGYRTQREATQSEFDALLETALRALSGSDQSASAAHAPNDLANAMGSLRL